jgi:hypothetical protein
MTAEEIRAFFACREKAFALRDAASLSADYAEDAVVESPSQAHMSGVVLLR